MEFWISVHFPSLKLCDCPNAAVLTTTASDAAINDLIFIFFEYIPEYLRSALVAKPKHERNTRANPANLSIFRYSDDHSGNILSSAPDSSPLLSTTETVCPLFAFVVRTSLWPFSPAEAPFPGRVDVIGLFVRPISFSPDKPIDRIFKQGCFKQGC